MCFKNVPLFRRFRKIAQSTVNFVMSIRFVLPHGTTNRIDRSNNVHKICWTIIQSTSFHPVLQGFMTLLPVVLYGCETWSLILREERRLRVFENRVLRRVFGPKGDEVTGEWRKLHNEELSDLYSLPNIVRVVKSRRMRWAGHVARMGEGRCAQGFGGETGGSETIGETQT